MFFTGGYACRPQRPSQPSIASPPATGKRTASTRPSHSRSPIRASARYRGGFTDFEATLSGGETPRLEGLARVASVVAQDENLIGHLQSPDFFDAERYPELTFSGSELAYEGDDVVIQGQLTLRGVTLPVELRGTISAPSVDAYGKDRIGVSLSTEVDRTAFGVSWNAELPNGGLAVSHETRLEAELSLVKA